MNTISKKTILSLDIGSKRIGLALWNPTTKLITPLPLRKRETLKKDLHYFSDLIQQHHVEAILIGLPLSLGEKMTPSTEMALFWVGQIKDFLKLPVYTLDESFSTKDALVLMKTLNKKNKEKENKKDSIAAAIILQEFIHHVADSLS